MPTIVRLSEGIYKPFEGNETLPGNIKMSLSTAKTYNEVQLNELNLFTAPDFIVPSGKKTIGEARYEIVGSDLTQIYDIEDIPLPTWEEIRAIRNKLLSESDWISSQDAKPTGQTLQNWKVYRQILRDIPQDYVTTDLIIWPSLPAYIKL
jgi:hypothetical protein